MSAVDYGDAFWSIETSLDVLMVHADRVEVRDGHLMCFRDATPEKQELMTLCFAPGEWVSVGASSVIHGGRVAVDSFSKRGRGPHFKTKQ